QGGNFMGQNDSGRSIIASWTPPCIRVTTRLLCPTTVRNCITAPDGTVITMVDPHEQWGYSYNHLRGSISWQGEGWPWWDYGVTAPATLHGIDTRTFFKSPSK